MRWWLLCLALVPLSAGPASACGNGKVLLSDTFDTLQSMWGDANDFVKVVGGQLQLSETDGGQHVGFTVEAPDTGPAVFVADDLKVTAIP